MVSCARFFLCNLTNAFWLRFSKAMRIVLRFPLLFESRYSHLTRNVQDFPRLSEMQIIFSTGSHPLCQVGALSDTATTSVKSEDARKLEANSVIEARARVEFFFQRKKERKNFVGSSVASFKDLDITGGLLFGRMCF